MVKNTIIYLASIIVVLCITFFIYRQCNNKIKEGLKNKVSPADSVHMSILQLKEIKNEYSSSFKKANVSLNDVKEMINNYIDVINLTSAEIMVRNIRNYDPNNGFGLDKETKESIQEIANLKNTAQNALAGFNSL